MLPDLIISSGVKGQIYINDRPLGEVDSETYQSFIGAGTFYMTFTPLEYKRIYPPITVKIKIEKGAPVFSCPYISIVDFTSGTFLLEITPPALAGNTLPKCLMFHEIESRFVASLMEQNCYYLVIEDEQKLLPDGFFQIPMEIERLSMEAISISGLTMLIVCDGKSNTHIFAKGEKGFALSLSLEANGYEAADNNLVVYKTTSFMHKIQNTYSVRNGVITLTNTEYETASPVIRDEEIVKDFLECVKYGVEKQALYYLSRDLTLSFSELKEFLGDYNEFKTSPFEENTYALIGKNDRGIYLASRFTFELMGGKIHNIQEL